MTNKWSRARKPGNCREDSDEEDDWYVQNLRLRKQRESWKPRCGSWVRLSNLQRARHLEGCLGEVGHCGLSLSEGFGTVDGRYQSIKNWIGPYQRTPKEVARAMRYPGLGDRSVGPVGDFLESSQRSFRNCYFFVMICKVFLHPKLVQDFVAIAFRGEWHWKR